MLLKTKIPFNYVFGKIKYEIIVILLYATLITVVHQAFNLSHISIPLSVPAILGTVLSLLLGFRSNQAYDRWWEARHVWGAIVNDSRTLARQINSFTPISYEDEAIEVFRQRVIKRQIAWNYSLGRHLRRQNACKGLEKYLDKREIDYLHRMDNVPAAILDMLGRDIQLALEEGWINRFQQVELDRTLSRLCDSMGKCERIKNTVFPITYSLYIHLAMMLFIILLPFGLIEHMGAFEAPLVVAISACFLLIEKMAIHLQDPFENKPTDTPVTHIAQQIEKNLAEMYGISFSRTEKTLVPVADMDEQIHSSHLLFKTNSGSFRDDANEIDLNHQRDPSPSYYVL